MEIKNKMMMSCFAKNMCELDILYQFTIINSFNSQFSILNCKIASIIVSIVIVELFHYLL